MPATSFPRRFNRISGLVLANPYTAGSHQFVLTAAPPIVLTTGQWVRLTVTQIVSGAEVFLGHWQATGVSGVNLTGVTPIDGTVDAPLPAGALISMRCAAEDLTNIEVAVNTLENATAPPPTTQPAHSVMAGPASGAAAIPAFRPLVATRQYRRSPRSGVRPCSRPNLATLAWAGAAAARNRPAWWSTVPQMSKRRVKPGPGDGQDQPGAGHQRDPPRDGLRECHGGPGPQRDTGRAGDNPQRRADLPGVGGVRYPVNTAGLRCHGQPAGGQSGRRQRGDRKQLLAGRRGLGETDSDGGRPDPVVDRRAART